MLRWLSGVLGLLALTVAGLLVFVLATEPGAVWLVTEIARFTPGRLEASGLHGTVAGGLAARELRVTGARVAVTATNAELRVDAAALLAGELRFDAVTARSVVVAVRPDPQLATPFHMSTLVTPIPVAIRGARIDSLVVDDGADRRSFTGIAFAAHWRRDVLEITNLEAGLAGATMTFAGSATLRDPLPIRARVSWRLAQPVVTGSGEIAGTLDRLRFGQEVRLPGPVRVTGSLVSLRRHPVVEAVAAWDAIAMEVPGAGTINSRGGRATLAGTPADWHADLGAKLQWAKLPEADATLVVTGAGGRLAVRDARVSGRFGLVTAAGSVDLAAGPEFRLSVRGANLDPAVIRPDARGRLAGEAELAGHAGHDFTATLRNLRGEILGRPVTGSGRVSWQDGTWTLADVRLAAGPNRLEADGTIGRTLAGRVRLEAPRLAALWPGLTGAVRGRGDIAGSLQRPIVSVELEGRALTAGRSGARAVALAARVDPRGVVDVDVTARGLIAAGTGFGDFTGRVRGTLEHHELVATLSGGAARGSIASHGAWDGRELRGTLVTAMAGSDVTGDWQLQPSGAGFLWSARHSSLADHCWRHGESSLCLAGIDWSAGDGHVAATLRGFPLGGLQFRLPGYVRIAGSADADVELRRTHAVVTGRLSWRQQGTTLAYSGDGDPVSVAFPVVELSAGIEPGRTLLTAHIAGDDGVELRGDATLAGPLAAEATLTGRLTAAVPDVAPFLLLLTPSWDLAEVRGRISAEVVLGGTAGTPRVTGMASLADGRIAWPDAGLDIDAINITARGDETATLAVEGTARAGGALAITGQLRLLGRDAPAGWVRLRGQDLDAVRIPDRYIRASPDVTVKLAAGRLALEGQVDIPRADIVVREIPAGRVSVSPDAVVHDRRVTRRSAAGPVIDGGITLNLGNEVRLRAFRLDTYLDGSLRLYQNRDGYTAADGAVRLREGRFGAYGKELTIERGTLGFSGALDDPSLDVRAARRVEYEGQSVNVGVQLSGTARRVQSQVFSEPAMSDADALSWLISGRPMLKSSATDRSSMASAALSLGLTQTTGFTGALGSKVALDELGVEGGSALTEAQVVAGKQLNPDLYVRVAYGLFSRAATVLARYRLSRHVSVEASGGENQALDLVYSIETD